MWLKPAKILCSPGRTLIVAVVFLAISVPAFGQVETEGGVVLELNYSNPGARSMGFGGAFAALADDATSAFANPSGLLQIVRPEISMEMRHRTFATAFTKTGRLDGAPTGIGLDTERGLRTSRSMESLDDLSFVSVVIPLDRWAIALYRHQLVHFRFSGDTQGLFGSAGACCGERYADQRTETDFDIVGYGLSAAHQVGERLSVGLGVSHFAARVDGYSALFLPATDNPFGLNPFLPSDRIADNFVQADSTSQGLYGGFLWNLTPRDHLGGFYRQGPRMTASSVATVGSETYVLPNRLLRFPDVYGLGLSHRSMDGSFTLAMEWDRIEYSTIVESAGISDFTLSDGDELHVGGEYVMLHMDPVVAFRFGAWIDPNHRTRYIEDNPFKAALHPRGGDEVHASLGFGIAFPLFQIDLGIDSSKPADTVSLSAIYSF